MKTFSDTATIQRLRADVARQISRFIDGKKLTRAAAAKLLQIPQSTVVKILSGRVSRLSLDQLMKVSVRAGLHLVVQTGAVPEEAGAFLSMSEPNSRQEKHPKPADRQRDEMQEMVRALTPEQRLYVQFKHSQLITTLYRAGTVELKF